MLLVVVEEEHIKFFCFFVRRKSIFFLDQTTTTTTTTTIRLIRVPNDKDREEEEEEEDKEGRQRRRRTGNDGRPNGWSGVDKRSAHRVRIRGDLDRFILRGYSVQQIHFIFLRVPVPDFFDHDTHAFLLDAGVSDHSSV